MGLHKNHYGQEEENPSKGQSHTTKNSNEVLERYRNEMK